MNDLLFASHTQRRALYAVERDGGLFEVLGDVSTPTVQVRLFGGIGFGARARAGAVQQDRGSGPRLPRSTGRAGNLVAFISAVMTLLPGDIISRGTPAGIGPLAAADVVTVLVSGVGDQVNPVVAG